MNDQDTIRKGVELADGWRIANGKGLATAGTICCPLGTAFGVESLTQEWKDALAAQLVRQVDALEHDTKTGLGFCQILAKDDSVLMAHVEGKARTMNTIKAIVDSKVLE